MATQMIPLALRIFHSDDLNSYALDAYELFQFLHPVKKSEAEFVFWLDDRIKEYDFEVGFDFEREDEGAVLTLNMAKELGRIERTEQGREARY